jgi:hypothetical protein
MQELFLNERVIQRAGGLSGLDAWLERKFECQWPHNEWHSKERYAITRQHVLGIDNQLREQTTERLAGIAMQNLVKWLLERVNIMLGFSADHTLTLGSSAGGWYVTIWLTLFPESVASKAL